MASSAQRQSAELLHMLVERMAHKRVVWVVAGLWDENYGFGTRAIVLQSTVEIGRCGGPAGVVQHERGAYSQSVWPQIEQVKTTYPVHARDP